MLTTTENPSYQLLKEGKIKPKTIVFATTLVVSLLFYSQSLKPATVVELSTNKQSKDYTKWVESLATNYLLLAEQLTQTPGNSCFKETIDSCLEQLKPQKPKQSKSEPKKAINSDLRQLGYQVRLEAISFAQEKNKKQEGN